MIEYCLRPGYGSDTLLIEFCLAVDLNHFKEGLFNNLKPISCQLINTSDLWMNDEVIYHFLTDYGSFDLSIDNYGCAFILANSNQNGLKKLDDFLSKTNVYIKKEVDFNDYK